MLGLRAFKSTTTSTKTPELPLLIRQKRPVEFALLTYVSQQDRAERSQPSENILRKLHEISFGVLKNMFNAQLQLQLCVQLQDDATFKASNCS
jgi:hypothetical protein